MVPVLYFCLVPYPGYFWSMRSLQSAQVMSAFAFSLLASTAALFFPCPFLLGFLQFKYFSDILMSARATLADGS